MKTKSTQTLGPLHPLGALSRPNRSSCLATCIAMVLLIGSSSVARGESPAELNAVHGIGSLDVRPAATLLLPYFEVELDGSETTLVRIRNASAYANLAHISLWTDLGRPTLGFNIYLTGFDTVVLDLGQLFNQGLLPATGPSMTPAGPFSGPNRDFADCEFPLPEVIPASLQEFIRKVHTGQPAVNGFPNAGLCGGNDLGDNKARGYLVANTVNSCSLLMPDEPGYFLDRGVGVAANRNTLWGEYAWQDPATSTFLADTLVHVEARSSVANGFWESGNPTFFGRHLGDSSVDNREPLPTSWAFGFGRGDGAEQATQLLCWRDTGLPDTHYFPCNLVPGQDGLTPFRLNQTRWVVFDQEENPIEIPSGTRSPPESADTLTLCPYSTTRVDLGDFPIPFSAGWIYVDLNTITSGPGDPENPVKQSHLTVVNGAAGSMTGAHGATPLDNALAPFSAPFPQN